jgi:zinc protease
VLAGNVPSRLMARLGQKDGTSYGTGSNLQASSFEPHGAVMLDAMYAPQNLERASSCA